MEDTPEARTPSDEGSLLLEEPLTPARREPGLRRISTFAAVLALTAGVFGVRELSTRRTERVASLAAVSTATRPTAGAAPPRTAFLKSKTETLSRSTYSYDTEVRGDYSYSYYTALLEGDSEEDAGDARVDHRPKDAGDDYPNTESPTATVAPSTLWPSPTPTLSYAPSPPASNDPTPRFSCILS